MEDNKSAISLALIGNDVAEKGVNKKLVRVRDLSDSEVDSLNGANKLLEELTASSPYKQFQDRYEDFFSKIDELIYNAANGKFKSHELIDVYGKLDDLLSSLKGFEDRTKSLISNRYGKESIQMTEFKKALSYEFDNLFEYRFSYNLRNYSQHKGSKVGEIKTNAQLINGKPVSSLDIILNCKKLLDQYSKWHSMVKKDLEELDSDFSLKLVIIRLKFSCFRVYSKYLLSQEAEILKAIEDIRAIVGNYNIKTEAPTMLKVHKDFSKSGGTMSLTPIKTNLIETLEPLLKSAHHFALMK